MKKLLGVIFVVIALFCISCGQNKKAVSEVKITVSEEFLEMFMKPTVINFEVVELPDLCIIGKEMTVKWDEEKNPIPGLWEKCFRENSFDTLQSTLADYFYNPSIVGYKKAFDDHLLFVVGFLMKPDAIPPDGFVKYSIEKGAVGVSWIKGKEFDMWNVFPRDDVAHRLTENSAREAGFMFDDSRNFYGLEFYDHQRHSPRGDINGNTIVDYYLPIKSR